MTHIYKEATVRLMRNLKATASHKTICGLLAKVYFSVEDEEVKLDIRKAVAMAKRMGNKLKVEKAARVAEDKLKCKKAAKEGRQN
jgi:hypothetical protein